MNSENQALVAETRKSKITHPYFVVDRKVGKEAIDICLKGINRDTVLPILEDILIEIDADGVRFRVTDLELLIEKELKVIEWGAAVSICVCAKQLSWFFNKSKEETVRISFDPNNVCTLKAGRFTIKLPTEDAKNFPKKTEHDYDHSLLVKTPDFAEAIGLSIPFLSNDDLRPSMTGVNVCSYNNVLTVVATDAHRLFYKSVGIPINSPYSQIYPRKFASLVANYFSKGEWTLEDNKVYVSASKDGLRIVARLIDSRYPDWPVVLPKENTVKIVVDRSALFNAVDLSSSFANKYTGQVVFTVHANKLQTESADLDYSTQSEGEIDAAVTGISAPYRVGINSRFLLAALRVNKGQNEVCISHVENPNKAIVVDGCVMVMPLMLNENPQ